MPSSQKFDTFKLLNRMFIYYIIQNHTDIGIMDIIPKVKSTFLLQNQDVVKKNYRIIGSKKMDQYRSNYIMISQRLTE